MTEATAEVRTEDGKIRCDACPVLCYIREGLTGACDRYANAGGKLVRSDPHVVLDRTLAHGGKVVTGGKRPELGGTFYEPTVIEGIDPSMRIWNEETFGPVAALTRFKTDDEAIELANKTPFGLAAYAFTRDLARTFRLQEELDVGIVGVNEGLTSTEIAPFGGVKESGLGREGSHHGVEEFVEMKYTLIGGL